MRWRDMHGRLAPILAVMADWYARRGPCERDDLVQEAWLEVHRCPHRPAKLVAQTAMHNLVQRARALRRQDRALAVELHTVPCREFSRDDLLDVPVYLGRITDRGVRIAVECVLMDGTPVWQVADQLGLSPSAVNRRVARGLAQMRGGECARPAGRYGRDRRRTRAGYRKPSKAYRSRHGDR